MGQGLAVIPYCDLTTLSREKLSQRMVLWCDQPDVGQGLSALVIK